MMDYKALKKQLQRHEGYRQRPYTDTVGKLTIGVGRNLADRGLNPDEIDLMLENDIEECVYDLSRNFPWWSNIDEVRQRALLDLRFNLGPNGFRQFSRTLGFASVGEWQIAAAAFRENKKYFAQVGKRAENIAHMIETGADPQ